MIGGSGSPDSSHAAHYNDRPATVVVLGFLGGERSFIYCQF